MFLLFEENKIGVPGFEQTIKPILMALQEHGGRASIAELNKATLRIMNLPEEVLKIMHKGSNRQSEMEYRIAWGRTYLKKYGLITNVARGIWALTDKFDGDIEKIDVNEILRQVRSESAESKEERTELTGFESALAFENMVGALLQELANKEGKRTEVTDSELSDLGYDMLLPDGLEGNQEEIKCMIKYVNDSKQNVSSFYNRVTQSLDDSFVTGKVLLITNVVVPDKIRNHFGPNIMIWDMNDLLERIEPEASYAQYLINPRQALIKDVISTDNSDQQKSYEREKYLKKIKSAFRNQDMVLFLGAGVSIDGGIPLWETLIKTLHVYMLNRLTKEKELSFEEQELIKELASDNEMESPLMQMRYIKAAFSNEEYYKLVHSALYSQSINIDTSLLNAISEKSLGK